MDVDDDRPFGQGVSPRLVEVEEEVVGRTLAVGGAVRIERHDCRRPPVHEPAGDREVSEHPVGVAPAALGAERDRRRGDTAGPVTDLHRAGDDPAVDGPVPPEERRRLEVVFLRVP